MATIQFPANPTVGQVFYFNNLEFTWSGNGWRYVRKERSVDMGTTAVIDLRNGEYFKKTITAATTFTVAGVLPAGLVSSFVMSITNGAAAAITWFANLKWTNGSPPTLQSAGRDVLGFITEDNGVTWTGSVISSNAK